MKSIHLWGIFIITGILMAIVIKLKHIDSFIAPSPVGTLYPRDLTHPDPIGPQPPFVHHVIIFSIDGCRPDLLLRADTPFIHSLLTRSSFTFYARTTDVAITLPSHVSMLTGVTPERHGIDFNSDPPEGRYPNVPTLLEIAHAHGMTTGVFSTKSKFSLFVRPNTIDYTWISSQPTSPDDDISATRAADAIREHQPGVMLVHLGNDDLVGHSKGWGSPEQFEALHGADMAIAKVFSALKDAGIDNDTLTVISADHGGSGGTHGADDDASRFIPWIATGPQVRQNYDITSVHGLVIRTEDTFATACYFLGLPLPENIDGKPAYTIIPLTQTAPAK